MKPQTAYSEPKEASDDVVGLSNEDLHAYLRLVCEVSLSLLQNPREGDYLVYHIVAKGVRAEGGIVLDAGTATIKGPVSELSGLAGLRKQVSTLDDRLQKPVAGAIYLAFELELNGKNLENTTALYSLHSGIPTTIPPESMGVLETLLHARVAQRAGI
jgi:hypothetical protein